MATVAVAGLLTSGVVLGESNADIERAVVATESARRLGGDPIAVTVTRTHVGPVALGQRSAEVLPYFEYLLGAVERVETQQLDSPILEGCFGGTKLTFYEWTGVTLVFVGDSSTPKEDDTLFDYRLDWRAVSDLLLGFETAGGARLGDPVERWLALHPDATYFPAEGDLIGLTIRVVDGPIGLADEGIGRIVSMSAVSPIFCE